MTLEGIKSFCAELLNAEKAAERRKDALEMMPTHMSVSLYKDNNSNAYFDIPASAIQPCLDIIRAHHYIHIQELAAMRAKVEALWKAGRPDDGEGA